MITNAFRRYVDRAREGRIALWRLGAGCLLVLLVWVLTTVAAFFVGAFFVVLGTDARVFDPGAFLQVFLSTPSGVASALASFVGMSGGVFLAVRWVHRRPFGSVLGASGRIAWGDVARGFAAAFVTSALAEAPNFLVDPSVHRSATALGVWLLWLVPTMLLLFIQVSAEELAFRGYLLQSLAARFRSPLVWALLPLLLFTALHWNAQTGAAMSVATLASIAAFAALATLLVVRTGNLSVGIGAHLGLNSFGILGVSHMSWLSGAALFEGRPVDVGDWSGTQALVVGLFGIAPFALMALMLLHPRSPLKVGSLDLPVAGTISLEEQGREA
jgi:CAAX protease family protein